MSTESSFDWRRQLLWGLLLIAFGTAVFLDQLGLFEFEEVWHYWPLLLVIFGINNMIGFPTARHFTNGLWMVFLGFWLYANIERMFGLTWHNSWPFLIIAVGVKMILEPFIKSRFVKNSEPDHEK